MNPQQRDSIHQSWGKVGLERFGGEQFICLLANKPINYRCITYKLMLELANPSFIIMFLGFKLQFTMNDEDRFDDG